MLATSGAKWVNPRQVRHSDLGSNGMLGATLTLVVWQWICAQAKVADVNYFLWEGQ